MQILLAWLTGVFEKGLNDWKTSLVAIIIIAVAVLYGRGIINENELMLTTTILSAIGFAFSRDSQKKKVDSSTNETGS